MYQYHKKNRGDRIDCSPTGIPLNPLASVTSKNYGMYDLGVRELSRQPRNEAFDAKHQQQA